MKIIYWEITDIPLKFMKDKEEIHKQFSKALYEWSKWILIEFIRLKNSDKNNYFRNLQDNYLEVKFGSFKHYCDEDFDGKGGTLAHGKLSSENDFTENKIINLKIHFDASEDWIFEDFHSNNIKKNGYYFYLVALHEIGHNLGLDHNDSYYSVMANEYSTRRDKLFCVDIKNAQKIHGIRMDPNCEITIEINSNILLFFSIACIFLFMLTMK